MTYKGRLACRERHANTCSPGWHGGECSGVVLLWRHTSLGTPLRFQPSFPFPRSLSSSCCHAASHVREFLNRRDKSVSSFMWAHSPSWSGRLKIPQGGNLIGGERGRPGGGGAEEERRSSPPLPSVSIEGLGVSMHLSPG